jgi:hypothetical protein
VSVAKSVICIEVPDYIARWIEVLSASGVNVSSAVRELLHRFYDMWVIGTRMGADIYDKMVLRKELADAISKCIEAGECISDRTPLYRGFATWLQISDKDICSAGLNEIREYIEVYKRARNIKEKTEKWIEQRLRKFVDFVKRSMCGEAK